MNSAQTTGCYYSYRQDTRDKYDTIQIKIDTAQTLEEIKAALGL